MGYVEVSLSWRFLADMSATVRFSKSQQSSIIVTTIQKELRNPQSPRLKGVTALFNGIYY